MAAIFYWNKDEFRPLVSDWQPVPVSRSAGPSLGNRTQIRVVDTAVWRGAFTMRKLYGDALREFRALMSSMRGRGNIVRVPIYDPFTPAVGLSDADYYRSMGIDASMIKCAGGMAFSDGTCFSDGTGFYVPTKADISGITASAAAVLGATQLTLSFALGIRVGVRFSVNDFLHEVTAINASTITFEPPLREAVASGAALNFTDPHIRVRLASDGEGAAPIERIGMLSGGTTLSFSEAFER